MDVRDARRACWRGLVLLVGLVAGNASALDRIGPGEQPVLKPGEALLVVAIDSDSRIETVRFERSGSPLSGDTINRPDKGRTTRLYVVPAGRYRWSRIQWSWLGVFELKEDAFSFEVKAGEISYPGDLVHRVPEYMFDVDVRIANRAMLAIDWLQALHPALYARYPLTFTGRYPDPFPDFYRKAVANAGATRTATPDAVRDAPSPAVLSLPPKVLWERARITGVALSPDGALIAESIREDEAKWALDLVDPMARTTQRLASSVHAFEDLRWKDAHTLVAITRSWNGPRIHAFHLGEAVAGVRSLRRVAGPVGGRLVDLLPGEPGTVLCEATDTKGRLVVHRLDLRTEEDAARFGRTSTTRRLNVGVEDDLRWFTDGHGRLRAALARREDAGEVSIVLVHGQDGTFRDAMKLDRDLHFQPDQLSLEGDLIYGLSEEGRDQRELVAFDIATGSTRTLHARPGVDLTGILYDHRRLPIGATYYRGGELISEYFDAANQQLARKLRQSFAGRSVAIVQRSLDARKLVAWVDAADQPPQLYFVDLERGHAQLLDHIYPNLSPYRFARAQVVKARGADGLPIEAFLTLPEGAGKRPLVVFPHGGPIGVSDDLHFNREVQFLASLGYAVLQVNFRGSEGYGRAFREAGHRNEGRAIEDDIDAAIRAAMAHYPLDESRMCALGASYGGFSAMFSTIRWPERFRCAVSMAGVSDGILFFTASDSSQDADLRKLMEERIGDPNDPTQRAAMEAASPLYRYAELRVPLMLVHGRQDERVDYEHSLRLVRMLNLAGRPPVLLSFDDEDHGLAGAATREKTWTSIAGFLGEHLGPASAGTSVAAPAR